jgi:hypothetical protein
MSQESIVEPGTHSTVMVGEDEMAGTNRETAAAETHSALRVTVQTRGGPTLLDAHRAGIRLTQRQGILAKCADCMGRYVDGRVDCRVPACPLYPWQPYRE